MQPKQQPPRLMLHSSTSGGRSGETQTNDGGGAEGAREWAVSEALGSKMTTGLRKAQTEDLPLSLATVKRTTEKGPS